LESVSGESGADSGPAPGEEKDSWVQTPSSACLRVQSGLAAYRQVPLSRPSFVVTFRREYATPPYTIRTHAHPDEAHHADSRPTQETQENAIAAGSTGTQVDGRVDDWLAGHSWRGGCIPCWRGRCMIEVCCVPGIQAVRLILIAPLRRFLFLLHPSAIRYYQSTSGVYGW